MFGRPKPFALGNARLKNKYNVTKNARFNSGKGKLNLKALNSIKGLNELRTKVYEMENVATHTNIKDYKIGVTGTFDTSILSSLYAIESNNIELFKKSIDSKAKADASFIQSYTLIFSKGSTAYTDEFTIALHLARVSPLGAKEMLDHLLSLDVDLDKVNIFNGQRNSIVRCAKFRDLRPSVDDEPINTNKTKIMEELLGELYSGTYEAGNGTITKWKGHEALKEDYTGKKTQGGGGIKHILFQAATVVRVIITIPILSTLALAPFALFVVAGIAFPPGMLFVGLAVFNIAAALTLPIVGAVKHERNLLSAAFRPETMETGLSEDLLPGADPVPPHIETFREKWQRLISEAANKKAQERANHAYAVRLHDEEYRRLHPAGPHPLAQQQALGSWPSGGARRSRKLRSDKLRSRKSYKRKLHRRKHGSKK